MKIMGHRKIWVIIAAFMAAAVMFSCKKEPKVNPPNTLSLSTTSASVGFDEASTSLTIVAYADWTLSVTHGEGWITPSVTSGVANSTVKINFALAPNEGEETRKGTVSVSASGRKDPYLFTITQNASNTLTGVNAWIHEQLSGWYYWNGVLKATQPPTNTLAYDEFLQRTIEDLPWSSVQDKSNGENPPTIDGSYRFNANDDLVTPLQRDQIYSYIERFPAGTRAVRGASESYATTFGFDVKPFIVGGNNTNAQIAFLVILVQPDSPADKADIKRGMWIDKYNDADITATLNGAGNLTGGSALDFMTRLFYLEGGNQMSFADESGKEYDLTAAETKISPIIHHEVIPTAGGSKVAYLLYNGFETGDAKGNSFEFDEELRDVFGEFKSAGATELVLDLRYNPGGYVTSCQILTSLAADVNSSDVFAKMLHNENIDEVYNVENPEIVHFLNESNSLKRPKIYVLATENSASASEMVINSIRGALGDAAVVHIGTRTNGKNVGMNLLDTEIDGYTYEMWPITFKILNSKDFTDYAGGFVPTLRIDEFWEPINVKGGVIYDFGDPAERMLKAALDMIDGNPVSPDTPGSATTRTDATGKKQVQGFKDPRRGGAKYIPTVQQ